MYTKKFFRYALQCLLMTAILGVVSCQKEEASNFGINGLAKSGEEFLRKLDKEDNGLVKSHKELLGFVKQDEVLKEVFYSNLEFTTKFLREVSFNEKGVMSFNFGLVEEYYPDLSEYILNKISEGFGFDYGELAEDYKGYKCQGSGTCVYISQSYICTSNCSVAPDLLNDLDKYQFLRDIHKYIEIYINPDFGKIGFDKYSIPHRISKEKFFEAYDFEKMFAHNEYQEQIRSEILEEKIIVMSSELAVENETVYLASLLFTTDSELSVVFDGTSGIMIDSRFDGSDDMPCYYGGYMQGCSCMWAIKDMCWTDCQMCNYGFEPLDLESLINPKFWYEDLILLGQIPINQVVEDKPLLSF